MWFDNASGTCDVMRTSVVDSGRVGEPEKFVGYLPGMTTRILTCFFLSPGKRLGCRKQVVENLCSMSVGCDMS